VPRILAPTKAESENHDAFLSALRNRSDKIIWDSSD